MFTYVGYQDVILSQASSGPPTATDDGCTAGSAVSGFNHFGFSICTDNVMDCTNIEGALLLFLFMSTHTKKQKTKYYPLYNVP